MSSPVLSAKKSPRRSREGDYVVGVLKGRQPRSATWQVDCHRGPIRLRQKPPLLHILGGLDAPTGTVRFTKQGDGKTLARRKANCATAPCRDSCTSSTICCPEFGALENVAMPPCDSRGITRARRTLPLQCSTTSTRASGHARKPGELSGGERQRAALARCR